MTLTYGSVETALVHVVTRLTRLLIRTGPGTHPVSPVVPSDRPYRDYWEVYF